MRKLVLIAAMVLTSAAVAQAGDSRSLIATTPITTAPAGTATAPASLAVAGPSADQEAQPQRTGTPGSLRADNDPPVPDTPQQSDIPRQNDAPRYSVRPAPVEAPPAANTPSANKDVPAVTSNDQSRPSTSARSGHSRRRGYWSEARIIGTLHRYGIYW